MKIPSGIDIYQYSNTYERIYTTWLNEAERISLETGIYIQVVVQLSDTNALESIYFRVDGHDFEGSADLQKAIANKAFL